jgi:hypothetical protein
LARYDGTTIVTTYHWREMEQEPTTNGHTQETTPAKGKPARIPVPKRKDVFRDLEKVAKPRKPPSRDEPGE